MFKRGFVNILTPYVNVFFFFSKIMMSINRNRQVCLTRSCHVDYPNFTCHSLKDPCTEIQLFFHSKWSRTTPIRHIFYDKYFKWKKCHKIYLAFIRACCNKNEWWLNSMLMQFVYIFSIFYFIPYFFNTVTFAKFEQLML